MSPDEASYSVREAVAWMRERLGLIEQPQGCHGLTRDIAAAYQDAHALPAALWSDLYKTAALAVRLGPKAPKRARKVRK